MKPRFPLSQMVDNQSIINYFLFFRKIRKTGGMFAITSKTADKTPGIRVINCSDARLVIKPFAAYFAPSIFFALDPL